MSSQRPSSEARVVLDLGKTLIASLEEASPAALDELERYCDLFAKWENGWKRGRDGAVALSAKDIELGRRIVAQHATVIKLTEEMRASVDRSLKSLRVRGKGLRAYTDHLPKRISTIRTRRG
jgi:hypothetical protein